MSFPAYSSYKDSEVEWLGPVPTHWSPTRLRFLAYLNPPKAEVSDLSSGTEVSFVPMEAIGESGELSLGQTRPLSEVLTGYTYFREGDVSIAKITPCFENGKGAIMRGLSGGVGFGTTELIIARPRPDATTPEFLDWLFRSPAFRARGEAAMYGAGGQKRVPEDFVRDFVSPGAPLAEQVAIAAFLDRETAKIDALIEEQRRLIALLREKRQAVISHAVTKGLDPHAPMKDSGIEWLGEVPAHWEVRRIKHAARMESGHTPDRKVQAYWVDCDIPWVSLHDTGYLKDHDYISETAQKVNALGIANSSARILPSGVVVFSRDATIGRCAITTRPMAVSQHFIAWVCGPALNAEFLLFCLRSMAGELERLTAGATLKTIGMPDVRTLTIAMPPLSEQHAIVAHARSVAEGIDALTADVIEALRLLQERRAALISAAVTGKIDVRGLAKVLPFPIERARARALVGTEIIERSAIQPNFGRVKFQKVAFVAEGHVGISELAGSYTRAAAGPLDGALIEDMERGAHSIAGIAVDKAGGIGTTVSYRLDQQRGVHRQELADWLGPDRTAKLDKLIADFADLNTKQTEAVATLYGVWNDLLGEGASPSDDEIITGFLNDWHPEKREKFCASELPEWLGWMRRHGIVPTGSGPKTLTGRLFV